MIRVPKGRGIFWLSVYISKFSNKEVVGHYKVHQKFHFCDRVGFLFFTFDYYARFYSSIRSAQIVNGNYSLYCKYSLYCV